MRSYLKAKSYPNYVVALMAIGLLYLVGMPRLTNLLARQQRLPPQFATQAEVLLIHPIMRGRVMCGDHDRADGMGLGDALGTDCVLTGVIGTLGPDAPLVQYQNDGHDNADWIGWHATLLAPFDATIESIHINPVTNRVGKLGKGRATSIVFVRSDSTRVVYAHLDSIFVASGQSVRAGDPVGTVGNNGQATSPHTHLGAWRGVTPLQIRFNQSAISR